MDKELLNTILVLDKKERMLSEIIVWLKAKGLWQEFLKDTGWRIVEAYKREK